MNYSKIKSFFSNQFSMSFIILILLLLIVIIKQNLGSSDLKKLISLSSNISNINNSEIEKSNLSSKNFIASLDKTISELNSVKSSLDKLHISDKYNKQKTLLKDGLSKNITLHNNLKLMLESPSNETLAAKNKECIELKNEINSIYKQCNELKLPASLGQEDSSITYLALNYINELIKLNRDKDITNTQVATYISQLDNLYNKFLPLTEDLFTIMNLMNEEKRSLATLLDDSNKKIKEFEELKIELYDLSVPIEFLDSFNSLKNVFLLYDDYINSMRNYLLHNLNNTSDNILLKKAESSYKNLTLSLEELKKTMAKDSIS